VFIVYFVFFLLKYLPPSDHDLDNNQLFFVYFVFFVVKALNLVLPI